MAEQNNIDVIITTGGTGLTGRDITPEALDVIADKHIVGFGELFRNISSKVWALHLFNQELVLCYQMENIYLLYLDHQVELQMPGMKF